MRKILCLCLLSLIAVACAADPNTDCCSGCLGDGSSRASGYVCRDGYCVCGDDAYC